MKYQKGNVKKKIKNKAFKNTSPPKKIFINKSDQGGERFIEKYKTLIKKIEDDSKKWKDIPCSCVGRMNVVEMAMIPQTIYRFNVIPIKLTLIFPIELK